MILFLTVKNVNQLKRLNISLSRNKLKWFEKKQRLQNFYAKLIKKIVFSFAKSIESGYVLNALRHTQIILIIQQKELMNKFLMFSRKSDKLSSNK